MKTLPEVLISCEPLKRMLYGAVPAKALLAAIELELFTHLQQPRTADQLAQQLELHTVNTGIFLDALVANELVVKREGRYGNAPLAQEFLVRTTSTYLGDLLLNYAQHMEPGLADLAGRVRQGPPARRRSWDPAARAQETEIYAHHQLAGRAQQAAAIVSGLPEFAGMERMLDLGGGAGLMGMAIVAAHPSMRGVLFDRPDVVAVARRLFEEHGMQGRMAVLSGDYVRDPIGEDYDLVWVSYTLQRSSLEPVLRRVHGALRPGGVCVSLAEGLYAERTQPALMVNAMLSMSLRCGGMSFEEGEVAQAMLRVGFRSVHSRRIEGPQMHGPGVLDIARRRGGLPETPNSS